MTLPISNAVRVLLLNDDNQMLLISVQNPNVTTIDGNGYRRFWVTVGGEIEGGESIQEAALREIHEETGLIKDVIELGPIVWTGQIDLVLNGKPTRQKEIFIVAKTKQRKVCLANITEFEKTFVDGLDWFSFEHIKKSNEIIFPVVMPEYLPDIISGKYPEQPIEIDLAKQPIREL